MTLCVITSTAVSRGMPLFSASSTPSENASICTARLRLIAIFIDSARPLAPDVRHPRTDIVEQRLDALEGALLAADHDRQLALLQRDDAARDRRVDHVGALLAHRAASAGSPPG